MVSAAGGCELATTTRVKTALKKFMVLLPVLSSRHFSYNTFGRVYSSWVRNAKIHANETWPKTSPDLQRLRRSDRAMIKQICNVKSEDVATVRSNELLALLEIDGLDVILREEKALLDWTR